MMEQLVQFMNALWLTIVPEGSLEMPKEIYRLLALGMRYWFLLLMGIIVFFCFLWYRHDCRIKKKQLEYLPDAGLIGQMIVIHGNEALPAGTVLNVPREGTIGSMRINDLCLPDSTIANQHLWFAFDETQGLLLYTFGNAEARTDEKPVESDKPTTMLHGTRLYIGPYELQLRLFAGFPKALYSQPIAAVQQAQMPVYYPMPPIVMPMTYLPQGVQQTQVPQTIEAPKPKALPPTAKKAGKQRDNRIYMRPKSEEPIYYPFADDDSGQEQAADSARFDDDFTDDFPTEKK